MKRVKILVETFSVVKVKLFAKFRELMGDEIEVNAKTVHELSSKLEEKLGEKPIIAVNEEIVNGDHVLDEGDRVVAMPKFNGG